MSNRHKPENTLDLALVVRLQLDCTGLTNASVATMTSLPTPPAHPSRMDIDIKPLDAENMVPSLDQTPLAPCTHATSPNDARPAAGPAAAVPAPVYEMGKAPPTPTSHPSPPSDPSSGTSSSSDSDSDDDAHYGEEEGATIEERRNKRPKRPYKPAYYYPTDSNTRGCPVFEPTMDEFRDFYRSVPTFSLLLLCLFSLFRAFVSSLARRWLALAFRSFPYVRRV
jgi:hypothetical protein